VLLPTMWLIPLNFTVFMVFIYVYCGFRKQPRIRDMIRKGGVTLEALSQPCCIFYIWILLVCLTSDWVYSLESVLGFFDPAISVLQSQRVEAPRPPQGLCDVMRDRVCRKKFCEGGNCYEEEVGNCRNQYPDSCETLGVPAAMRWLVVLSPPCVVLAMLISLYHTKRHMMYGRPWSETEMDFLHDYSIQICALAPVYGLFSLLSVVHMVEILEGRTDSMLWKSNPACDKLLQMNGRDNISAECWESFIDRGERWYNLNFLVADLYEARVLYCFASLCMEYIELQRRKRGVFSHSCPKCRSKCPSCEGENTVVTHLLLQPLKKMTLLGVTCFVWTNFFRSLLMLGCEALRENFPDYWDATQTGLTKLGDIDGVVEGFVLCVSSIAIWNLITFESHLHDALSGFSPFLKFLSAKIIVSLAFLQEIALICIGRLVHSAQWLQPQHMLAYASLMSVEILLVAVLQYYAWRPQALESIAEFRHQKSLLLGCPVDGEVTFCIARDGQKLQLAVAETVKDTPDGQKVFWESASVTLLANDAA